MLDRKEVSEAFMQLKNVLYVEKDKDGNIVAPTDKETLELYRQILQSNVKCENNQFYHKDSKTWYQKSSKNIIDPDTKEIHKIEFFEDVTKEKEKEHTLKIDALTSLINDRNESDKLINNYIKDASKRNEEFSLIMADLDDFKEINDTFGHECGDLVLSKIGLLLLNNTRQSDDKFDYGDNDIVSRIGGDEFLILLKNISLEDTKKKIDKISDAISKLLVLYKSKYVDVSMSFGYYHINKNDLKSDEDIEKLRKTISRKADDYLYVNKNRKKESYLRAHKSSIKQKGMK